MFSEIVAAFKSKRTLIAVLTCIFATVNSQLSEPLIDAELLEKLVVIITGLIVGDSLRPVVKDDSPDD